MTILNSKSVGYWIYESTSQVSYYGGKVDLLPKYSFVVFSKNGNYWSGCDVYSIGNFKEFENEILVSDETYGNLKEFKYHPNNDRLDQYFDSSETGRDPATVTYARISPDDFKPVAMRHLCRIRGVGKIIATKLVESQILFILEIANWSDENILFFSAELGISIEKLNGFRKAAQQI